MVHECVTGQHERGDADACAACIGARHVAQLQKELAARDALIAEWRDALDCYLPELTSFQKRAKADLLSRTPAQAAEREALWRAVEGAKSDA